MEIEVKLNTPSDYNKEFKDVKRTYNEGGLYCIEFNEGSVYKIPIRNIININENKNPNTGRQLLKG